MLVFIILFTNTLTVMRKTILSLLLLAAIFSIIGCCNSQTHAEEIDEIQIIEPVDTLANIPMTIKFTSLVPLMAKPNCLFWILNGNTIA